MSKDTQSLTNMALPNGDSQISTTVIDRLDLLRAFRTLGEAVRKSTTLSVIVPVYNEPYLVAASLQRLLCLAESSLLDHVKIIVVDDGSSDTTVKALARFRESLELLDVAKLSWLWLRHHRNRGKGAAVRTGLEHADTELVVIHDADLEYHPRDLVRMVEVFLSEDADAVFGSRFMSGSYKRALFFRHQLGNKFLTFLCDLVSDLNLTDIETCYKMVRTDLLKSIPLESSTFDLEPELAIKLAKRRGRVFEVPISYSGRTYREGKKIGWKDGLYALWAILRYAISDRIYTIDGDGGGVLERLNQAPRFTSWMAAVVEPYIGKRVLEIGAGIGNMSVHLMPRSIYYASDINMAYVEHLRTLLPSRPYMGTACVDALDGGTFPAGLTFDTVVCLNVLEHLCDDVLALRNILNALDPGGRAIILVPNGPRLYGSLDEILGHFRRYTRKKLETVAEQSGFLVERIMKFNRAGVPAWWLNARILKRTTFGFVQVRMLNTLVPLFRFLDPYLPLPPLSLIAILKKPDGLSNHGV